ncbi:DUF3299 domain-containing protein [Cupriavidus gilardii]|uniref:DUF3299 domain-containing protein n=1 Tax=Cupriavidus gilardii TaxID=82541 RepID=UPI001FC9F68E|nr:DUF3299 domain-containing protein [Cupriavidus gilardii]
MTRQTGTETRTSLQRRKWLLGAGGVAALSAAGLWWIRRDGGSAHPSSAAPRKYAIGESLEHKTSPTTAAPAVYREIEWDALLPKGWDPLAPLKGLDLAQMEDGDPRAKAALEKAKQYWQEAPVEPSLDGSPVRLPGFVVSLGGEGEAIREFLLVPYFGACIHVPPPPANQVVHVQARAPLQGIRTMDTVWIEGVLRVERAETAMGDSGYAMREARVEPYLEPKRERR